MSSPKTPILMSHNFLKFYTPILRCEILASENCIKIGVLGVGKFRHVFCILINVNLNDIDNVSSLKSSDFAKRNIDIRLHSLT